MDIFFNRVSVNINLLSVYRKISRDKSVRNSIIDFRETAERIKEENLTEEEIKNKVENNRIEINKVLPEYARISSFNIQSEEFIKNPSKKIKRFLYK